MTKGTGQWDMWSGITPNWNLNNFVENIPDAATMPKIVDYLMPDALKTIVSSWNCSEKVVTVGNVRNRAGHIDYNGNQYTPGAADFKEVGNLSKNSSKGPTRTGLMKPDITAGGDVALSSAPMIMVNNPGGYAASLDSGGWHIRNGGTSMASPIVAGAAALFLERCPNGTYQGFKNLVTSTAFTDQWTGTVPNTLLRFW